MHEQNLNDRYKRPETINRTLCKCKDTGEEIYIDNEIDYKELLIKYIKHIKNCGLNISIYPTAKEMNFMNFEDNPFTDEEIIELNKLSE